MRQLSHLKEIIILLLIKNTGHQQRDKEQLTGRKCWVCDDASCVPSASACWGKNRCSPLWSTARTFLRRGHTQSPPCHHVIMCCHTALTPISTTITSGSHPSIHRLSSLGARRGTCWTSHQLIAGLTFRQTTTQLSLHT